MGGYHWLVKHRYSEFHEMHEQVCPHLVFIYDSMVDPQPPLWSATGSNIAAVGGRKGGAGEARKL